MGEKRNAMHIDYKFSYNRSRESEKKWDNECALVSVSKNKLEHMRFKKERQASTENKKKKERFNGSNRNICSSRCVTL